MAAGRGRAHKSSWAFKVARLDESTNLVKQQMKWGDKDATEKTMFTEYFFDAAPSGSTGQIKVYNGSWVAKPVKVWTGSAWVTKPVKRWNGSSWVLTNY